MTIGFLLVVPFGLLFAAFFFDAIGTKKKAWQKRNAVSVGCAPTPAGAFWKKLHQKLKWGAFLFTKKGPLYILF